MTQAETDLQTLSQNASITASLPENMYISAVGIQGQQVYISASQTGEDGADTASYVYAVDRDTGALNLLYQQMSSIIQICPLEDETLWLATWNYDQDTGAASSALLHVDAAGQELARIDIQSLVDTEDNYINYLLPDTGGAVVVFVGGHLMALDSQGNITAAMDMTDSSCSDLTILSTGEIMGVFRQVDALGNVGDSYIAQVDLTAQTVTPWNMGDDIDWGLYPQILCDDGNTLWISHDDVVCTYDRASGLAQEQFTWVSAGVNAIQMLGAFLDDDGTLWAVSSSQAGDSITIFPVQTADSSRKTLTLATMFLSYTARLAVTAFNQENPDYCIEVKEYLSSGGNINDSLEQFAYDVMSGDVPDIVDLSEMDYDSLLQKGLLQDLTPYIDGENGLDRSEYLESVFDANTDETGTMYSLIPHFSISTLAGDASVFGSAQGCTLEQLEQAAQTCADTGMVLFPCASRKDVLYYLLPNISLENYMDRTTNTCSFNSQEFVDCKC
jgi:hypothetical protein